LAQYTLTGSIWPRKTHNRTISGLIGTITVIGVSAILILFSVQDYKMTAASPTGQPVTHIFLDTVGNKGAIVLMVMDRW
jgi:hypothetical protein